MRVWVQVNGEWDGTRNQCFNLLPDNKPVSAGDRSMDDTYLVEIRLARTR